MNSLSFGLLVAILALLFFCRVLLLLLVFLLCFVRVASPFFRLHFCCVLSDFPLILMLLFLFEFGEFVGVSVDVSLFQVRVFLAIERFAGKRWKWQPMQKEKSTRKLESMFNGYRSFIDSLCQFAQRYWPCYSRQRHIKRASSSSLLSSLQKLWHRCAKN